MKAYQTTDLGRAIVRFFQEYLPTLRGMSHHTIRSYRDSMILFLGFAKTDCGRPIESLTIADITAERIGRFLAWLESDRRNGISTRNARLAGLHTFARFLVAENPEHMAALQQVLGIPFKRGARAAPIERRRRASGITRCSRSCSTRVRASTRSSTFVSATFVLNRPTKSASSARATRCVFVPSGRVRRRS